VRRGSFGYHPDPNPRPKLRGPRACSRLYELLTVRLLHSPRGSGPTCNGCRRPWLVVGRWRAPWLLLVSNLKHLSAAKRYCGVLDYVRLTLVALLLTMTYPVCSCFPHHRSRCHNPEQHAQQASLPSRGTLPLLQRRCYRMVRPAINA